MLETVTWKGKGKKKEKDKKMNHIWITKKQDLLQKWDSPKEDKENPAEAKAIDLSVTVEVSPIFIIPEITYFPHQFQATKIIHFFLLLFPETGENVQHAWSIDHLSQ